VTARGPSTAVPRLLIVLALVGASFVLLPFLALVWRTPWDQAWSEITTPEVAAALRLSLVCSLAATALSVVLGLPLAWVQARLEFPGRALLRGLTTLPVILPPVVGGVALLLAFGRRGVLGQWLDATTGIRLPFTGLGVVVAETFVAMPFFVLTLESALRSVDTRLEDAARSLGASPWTVLLRVTLPLVRPALLAGAVLAWARALGEFGATITFAGNVPGKTQTLPLAVYLALETRPEGAMVLSVLMVAVSLSVLIGLRRQWVRAL